MKSYNLQLLVVGLCILLIPILGCDYDGGGSGGSGNANGIFGNFVGIAHINFNRAEFVMDWILLSSSM